MDRRPSPTDLTDEQWAFVESHLPPQPALGRHRRHDRQVLNAIRYVMRTGCGWCDLPHDLGDDSTAHHWFLRWMEEGVQEKIWFAILNSLNERQQLDWAMALLDGSFVPAKKGGARWLRAQRQRRDDPPVCRRQRPAAADGGDHCHRA